MTGPEQGSLFGGGPPDGGSGRPPRDPRPSGAGREHPRSSGAAPSRHAEAGRPDGRTPETAVSVSALNFATRRLLEERVPELWVHGEVTRWTAHRSGHRYFSLRDDQAMVSCVLFSGDAWKLPLDPEVGMQIAVHGKPTLYAEQGRYQLVVRSVQAVGEGLWQLAFERLRRTLDAEGLLDPSRRRPLPPLPRRVGVVTSTKGAALQDVVTVLRRRSPWVDVLVRDCRVQGEGAALAIRDAIEQISTVPGLDTIILTRGGGSVEDLWCFNEETAVRAVAACPIPIVCAIGHEVDVTLCELVADRRAPTPSVAAEIVAPDRSELQARVGRLATGLAGGLRRRVMRGQERLDVVRGRLPRAVERARDRAAGRLGALAGRLDALSPLRTLARGYAVATGADGSLLPDTDAFSPGLAFRLRLRDGSVDATAERVTPDAPGAEGAE